MIVKTNNAYMTAKLTSTGAIIPQVCIATIGRNEMPRIANKDAFTQSFERRGQSSAERDYEEDADNA